MMCSSYVGSRWATAAALLFSTVFTGAMAQTPLLGGKYTPRNDVTKELAFAKDCADMREAQTNQEKKDIFEKGKNSLMEDIDGGIIPVAVATLSTTSAETMAQDPLYAMFRHAFMDLGTKVENEDIGMFDEKPVGEYGKTIVIDLFNLDEEGIETEAAVVMIMWMAVAHELEEVLRACKNSDANTKVNILEAVDRAAAYWVGDLQERGDSETGQLMYNIAEQAGERFGQTSGEVDANTFIIDGFNEIQQKADANICSSSDESDYIELRNLVESIYAHMTIPLVQQMIHHMQQTPNEGADDYVELYALALLPQIAYCDAEAYNELLGYTVTSKLTASVRDDVIYTLQKSYSCLGITCADIGSYQNGAVPACDDDFETIVDLAGYTPATNVKQWSYLDRDLSLIKAFMNTRAFEAAHNYYTYGHSASIGGNLISFKQLATSSNRHQIPQFEDFSNALGGDDYADQLILAAFDRKAPFDNASTDQLTSVVVDGITALVTYMAAMEYFRRASLECGGEDEGVVNLWDIGAALFIGSNEGPEHTGSDRGNFLYGLAKALCDSFDNCLLDDAPVNQAIIQALRDGRDALVDNDCLALEGSTNIIMPALPVSLVQCTLQYATVYDKLTAGSQDGALGTGYICGKSTFPLLYQADPDAAEVIDENMEITPATKPIPDGPQAVFDAFREAFGKGREFPVTCAFVGTHNYVAVNGNVCPDLVLPPPTPTPPPVVAGTPTLPPVTPAPVVIPPTASPTYEPMNFPTHAPKERYEFTTDVDTIMHIALDVRDMANAEDMDELLSIYTQGKNSKEGTTTYTIEGFSTNAADTMKQNRIFSIFRYALADEEIFGGSEAVDTTYADVVVKNAIEVTADAALAAEAAIVLDVWMQVSHYLDEAVRGCERGEDSTPQLDLALGLWVGSDQNEGEFDSGHLLYNVAQTASKRFGHPERECDVNAELIDLFNEAKDLTEECATNSQNSIFLRDVIARTYSQMAVPLLQNLIYYIITADDAVSRNLLKVYALSFIPHGAACNPDGYEYLKDTLVDNDVTEDQFDLVFSHIEDIMFCLRIDCDDLSIPPTPQFSAAYDYMCAGGVDFDLAFDFAGYIPKTNVNEILRLDLDILQIGIFLETEAYEAAVDYYTYGYNAQLSSGTLLSLSDLATSDTRTNVPLQYEDFHQYYENQNYADAIMLNILNRQYVFADASPQQLSALATSYLQGMVMYMAVLEKLYTAIDDCKNSSSKDGGVKSWDTGAAMYVGSIDAVRPSSGMMMYALGNEMCEFFETCDNTDKTDRAYVSKRIMEALVNGKNLLDDGQCDGAFALITNSIIDILPVPLVQATLHFAKENEMLEAGTDSPELGRGNAYASSIVPLANDENPDEAAIIENNMHFVLTDQPVPDGSQAVFSAFVVVLPGFGIDCNDVGKYIPVGDEETSVCAVEEERPEDPGDTPTDLGDGLYTTTTYVQDRANIAADMVEIMKQLENGNKEIAREIYARGGNSDIFNENGVKIGQRSFGNFSTSETLQMKDEEMYALYTYALQDNEGKFNGRDVRLYADSIVQEAFETRSLADKTVGGEAALVFNLWMYTVHELYQTLRKCKNRVIADTDGVHSIDEVVAYWIGDGQQTGSQNGHLLYAWAETQGNLFRSNQFGQTRTNSNIIRLFNEAKLELSFPNACVDNPNTYPRLRIIVDKIIAVMTVPIIQGLIHYLRNTDTTRARLYAKAFIPHAAGCNLGTYQWLKTRLIDFSWSAIEVDAIVEGIESTYSCLGLTCEDIGEYRYYDRKTCENEKDIMPLADYTPESDVRPYSRLDLDVLSMYISMSRGAYGAAADTYKHGKHAVLDDGNEQQVLSLYQLATSTGWSSVPQFDSFARYYGSDRYANDIVQRGLAPSLDPHASLEQRSELVVKGSQLLVVQMAVLAAMHEALDDCKSANPERQAAAGAAWDKAAAYLAGSNGRTKHGLMHFALADNRCAQFGTCDTDGKSQAGKKLTTLLYAGRAEINGKACSALSKTIEEIVPVLFVPLIQGTLRYAVELNKGTNVFGATTNGDVAEGYIYSRSILPLVEDANRESAVIIDRNFDWPDATSTIRTNTDEIFDAFSKAYKGLKVDCKMVGETSGFSACEGARYSEREEGGGDNTGMIVGIIVGVIAAVAVSALIWVKHPNLGKDTSSVMVDSEQAASLVTNEAGLVESGENKSKNPFGKKSEEVKLVRNEAGEFNEDSQMNENAVHSSQVNHNEPLKGEDVEDALV